MSKDFFKKSLLSTPEIRLLRSRERTENAYIEPWPCVVQGMHTLDFSYKLRDTPPALGAEQQPACITPA